MIYIGGTQIVGSYLGQEQTDKVYVGSEVVISGSPSYDWVQVSNITSDKSQFNGWEHQKHLQLPFMMTTGTSIRIKYQLHTDKNYPDRICGYSWEDDWINAGPVTITDEDDYRLFGSIMLDINDGRIEGGAGISVCVVNDITFGNNFIYDNVTNKSIAEGAPVSTLTNPNFCLVDLSCIYLFGIQVFENGNLAFDLVPAHDNSHIGLGDLISGELFYPLDTVPMAYDTAPSNADECDCINNGGTWDSATQTCTQPEDPCAEFSSQEECDCVQAGGVWDGVENICNYPTPDPCEGFSSQEECDCVQRGGSWDGVECTFPEPDPCGGMSQEECDCMQQGGTWDPETLTCTSAEPDPEESVDFTMSFTSSDTEVTDAIVNQQLTDNGYNIGIDAIVEISDNDHSTRPRLTISNANNGSRTYVQRIVLTGTTAVRCFDYAFNEMTGLTYLDINISGADDIENLYYRCPNLQTIKLNVGDNHDGKSFVSYNSGIDNGDLPSLTDVVITGTFPKTDILLFGDSSGSDLLQNLSLDSLRSIINALPQLDGGESYNIAIGETNWGKIQQSDLITIFNTKGWNRI